MTQQRLVFRPRLGFWTKRWQRSSDCDIAIADIETAKRGSFWLSHFTGRPLVIVCRDGSTFTFRAYRADEWIADIESLRDRQIP